MREWRDISTAPKDGTVVLICDCGLTLPPRVETLAAYWSQCPAATGGSKKYPWVFLDPTNETNGYQDNPNGPTHWMPLPPPPSSMSEGKIESGERS